MKFTLIAAVIAIALAQGSLAQELPDFERLSQMFQEARNTMTEQVTELLRREDVQNHAQTVQEHLKSVVTNLESQLKPMADNMQTQFQPMFENFQRQLEGVVKILKEQAASITN